MFALLIEAAAVAESIGLPAMLRRGSITPAGDEQLLSLCRKSTSSGTDGEGDRTVTAECLNKATKYRDHTMTKQL